LFFFLWYFFPFVIGVASGVGARGVKPKTASKIGIQKKHREKLSLTKGREGGGRGEKKGGKGGRGGKGLRRKDWLKGRFNLIGFFLFSFFFSFGYRRGV